jgi:ubiquinol-cytochrome c reductase cytochrome c1 subunit
MVKFTMVKHIAVLASLLTAFVALAQTPQAPSTETSPAAAAPAGTQEVSQSEENKPVDWEHWRAHNSVADVASLQRGARNFMNYCIGCHSLKYMRYQRMATDLKIPKSVLTANLLQPGASELDYITTPMPPKDAEAWFGKVPPDLSLIARSKGPDHIYRFLKTFYEDPSKPTGTDNLALPGASMPAVISDLEGVKKAVFREQKNAGGTEKVFERFETVSPGNMTPEEYDGFVRDTVNFLDYVGEPAQVERRSMGVWVVLFLLALTALAYLLKQEYWKDVH